MNIPQMVFASNAGVQLAQEGIDNMMHAHSIKEDDSNVYHANLVVQ